MTKIADTQVKKTSGGYARIFNDDAIGTIFSTVHATNIRNGNELEHIIEDNTQLIPNDDLDTFILDISKSKMPIKYGIYICPKRIYRKSSYRVPGHEPDYIVFDINSSTKKCSIVELKDGDTFDTKKSESELDTLIACTNTLAPKLPCTVQYYICSFNQTDKNKIYKGFKERFEKSHILTGDEFCKLIKLDYSKICKQRLSDATENRKELVTLLLQVPWFAQEVQTQLNK